MKSFYKILTTAILSALITSYLFTNYFEDDKVNKTSHMKPIPSTYSYNTSFQSLTPPTNFIEAASKSIDAVVHVKNTSSRSSFSALDLFFNRRLPENTVGTGSGVIVSPDGYIITNNHVIENANKIEVTTNDNKVYTAVLVGTDPSTDIAVLKINVETDLPYLFFGNSENTRIGEWVLAVGNPFNLTSTVTAGIISAKSRDLNENDSENQSFIQTDAAVNMGNSGGALVNTNGELIGINTAITSMSGGFVGYSFAVPSNIARKIFEDILEFGNVQKGLLGVSGRGLNAEYAEFLSIPETEGFYVADIEDGMGAKEAGIKSGDIIVKVDEVQIKSFSDLTGYLGSKRPNEKVEVTYLRNSKKNKVSVILRKLSIAEIYGMKLKNLNKSEMDKLDLDSGVKVIESDSSDYPIENGTIILKINGFEIKNIDDLKKIKNKISSVTILTNQGLRERILFR